MKSIFKIAVEAMITVSLIALLSLVVALVYGLLSLLSPQPEVKAVSVFPTVGQMVIIPPVMAALSAAQDAPELVDYSRFTSRELRKICKEKRLPKWNKLTKAQMVAALQAEVIG